MPERKKPVQTPMGMREGTVVQINSSQENFNTYMLEDGTVLKMKTVAVEVLRIDGEFDEEGNPAYAIRSTQIVQAEALPERRRKPN